MLLQTVMYLLKQSQIETWWKLVSPIHQGTCTHLHRVTLVLPRNNFRIPQSSHIIATNEFTNVPKTTMDAGKTNRQMFDVIKVKLPLVISLSVKGFLLHILWESHSRSPLKTRLKCNLYPRQPSAGRSPDKLTRLKKENIHLKIKFTIHSWSCQQAGQFETVARSRRIQIYFKTSGVICSFLWVMFQNSQPLKFRLMHMVHVNCFVPHMENEDRSHAQPLYLPAKVRKHRAVTNSFVSHFIPPKYCLLLLRAGFHLRSGHCHHQLYGSQAANKKSVDDFL